MKTSGCKLFRNFVFFLKVCFFSPLSLAIFFQAKQRGVADGSRKATVFAELAVKYNKFYRHKYDRLFTEGRIAVEFGRLPLLTRDEVRKNFDSLLSTNVRRKDILISSTGGTSGVPLAVGRDKKILLNCLSWWQLIYWGSHPSANAAFVYRAVPQGFRRILKTIFLFPTLRVYLAAGDISFNTARRFFDSLISKRVEYIVAYVGSILVLTEFLKHNKKNFPALKFIWVTASPLSKSTRVYIESIWGVPVYQQYGSCEFYWIAAERLDRRGLDVLSNSRYVEIVDESGNSVPDGVFGQVVVTDLLDKKFPLIRYLIGDRGRYLPYKIDGERVLDYIAGRVTSIITLPSGKILPGELLTTIFDDFYESVELFKVYQYKDYRISVSLVVNDGWTDTDLGSISSKLAEMFGDCPWSLNFLDNLPDDNGKVDFVYSEIKF